jgi:hypothetical protein
VNSTPRNTTGIASKERIADRKERDIASKSALPAMALDP